MTAGQSPAPIRSTPRPRSHPQTSRSPGCWRCDDFGCRASILADWAAELLVRRVGHVLARAPLTELDAQPVAARSRGRPPIYYCLAWVWTRIFGFDEAGLRSGSLPWPGCAWFPVVYGIASKLISRRAGLIAAALAACNPLLIWYSQEATLLLAAGADGRACRCSRSPHALSPAPLSPGWLVAWGLAAPPLTLATHYYGVLAVVPQAAWLLWVHRRDRKGVARRRGRGGDRCPRVGAARFYLIN